MFHCLNWDHHLATVVHLWKMKGMNGKVGHASNLKSWWGHIIAQFQNGTDIFSFFLKIMKKLNLRNYIDEDKERSYTVEGTLLHKFKWHWHEKIKITNKYFDEDTFYFHSHCEKLHIIAQHQNMNLSCKKTKTEIWVYIIFLFVFLLIWSCICTYLTLYLYLFGVVFVFVFDQVSLNKSFPGVKGQF